jgi:hypothetical protein
MKPTSGAFTMPCLSQACLLGYTPSPQQALQGDAAHQAQRQVVLHKVMLAGEGCFVTHSISTLFIRRNWGRALPVYHYPNFSIWGLTNSIWAFSAYAPGVL